MPKGIPAKGYRDKSRFANFGNELAEPGDNAKYVGNALIMSKWPKVDLNDPEKVQERVDKYFQFCSESDMKPGVAGLAFALGVSRQYLWELDNNKKRIGQKSADIIKNAYNLLELLWEQMTVNNKMFPGTAIFLAKNHWKYKDEQDVVVEPKNVLGDTPDVEAIAAKYAELPED